MLQNLGLIFLISGVSLVKAQGTIEILDGDSKYMVPNSRFEGRWDVDIDLGHGHYLFYRLNQDYVGDEIDYKDVAKFKSTLLFDFTVDSAEGVKILKMYEQGLKKKNLFMRSMKLYSMEGKLNGTSIFFNSSREIERIENYAEGNPVGEWLYFEKGEKFNKVIRNHDIKSKPYSLQND